MLSDIELIQSLTEITAQELKANEDLATQQILLKPAIHVARTSKTISPKRSTKCPSLLKDDERLKNTVVVSGPSNHGSSHGAHPFVKDFALVCISVCNSTDLEQFESLD